MDHLIFNKVVTYRLEAFDFVRKCFAKISHRKFPDNFKRATMQNTCRGNLCSGVLVTEIAGIISRLAALVKKRLHQGGLPVNMLELFLKKKAFFSFHSF